MQTWRRRNNPGIIGVLLVEEWRQSYASGSAPVNMQATALHATDPVFGVAGGTWAR
jgi:hypothetical protein